LSDIKTFAVEETGVIELVGPNDEPMIGDDGKRMTVTVFGPGSKPYVKAQTVMQNKMIEKLQKRKGRNQTAEERVREQAEFLAGCTKAFSDNIEYDALSGEALYLAVYSDERIGYIAEQVNKHIGDWANFTKVSTTT
jgi:hypothetical protein